MSAGFRVCRDRHSPSVDCAEMVDRTAEIATEVQLFHCLVSVVWIGVLFAAGFTHHPADQIHLFGGAHDPLIMSALRTYASSIFRIADFSWWRRVQTMTFAEQLSGFTAADLTSAFPGIPRSTAYDWLSGVREPVAYLQPVALAHLRSAKRTQNKSLMPSAGKRLGRKRSQ